MKLIDAKNLDYRTLNEELRKADEDCTIEGCCGQRFIAAGMSDKTLIINGIPGNALGAYLNNANITVNANAQDAVGDTMNEGKILIHGNIGDAAGYAMHFKESFFFVHRLVSGILKVHTLMGKMPEVFVLGIVGFAVYL